MEFVYTGCTSEIHIKDDSANEDELWEYANRIAMGKYCPVVKDYCMVDGCAFYEIGRKVLDRRVLRASCTYMGTRHLVEIYAKPKDYDIEDL